MTRPAFDIIVIGGGIAGISAAAELAAEARVLVLEREVRPGAHSTGRSAAVLIDEYGNAAVRALTAAARPFFDAPDPECWPHPLLTPRGELLIALPGQEVDLRALAALSREARVLAPAEALALVPILNSEALALAAHFPRAADIDVDLLLHGYLRLLRQRGGALVTGAEVTSLEHRGGTWTVKTATAGYSAAMLVNAAGAWADQIAALADLPPIGLVALRRSAVILPAPDGVDVSRWPLFGSVNEDWYAKPMSGKLMVSPADEDPVPPQDAWTDDLVLAEGLDRFARMTTLTVTRVERGWAGLRSFVADRAPVVGFDARAEGFFWLAGQGGYGIQTAPALARLTRALVAEETAVDAALSPGRPSLRS